MRWLWQGVHYWPVWMIVTASVFTVKEFWSIASGKFSETLSDWVRAAVHVSANEPITSWGAGTYIVFSIWTLGLIWLTFHFFFYSTFAPLADIGL